MLVTYVLIPNSPVPFFYALFSELKPVWNWKTGQFYLLFNCDKVEVIFLNKEFFILLS